MQAYPWPGNVRELRNVVERAALLASGPVLDITDLALGRSVTTDAPRVPEQGFALPSEGLNLFDLEKDLVRQALDYAQGNQSQACKLLGITRDQIRHRIAKYGLDANEAD